MLTGVLALLERSVRSESREWPGHVFRLAALGFAYLGMCRAAEQARFFGAPGLMFFQWLMSMNSVLIAAAGISYFSSTITEEKEEGTLGLMRMTGLSSLGVLVGKTGGRFVQAVLLVLLQLPLALLGITLGGVTLVQVTSATLALISLLVLVTGVAVLVSVVSSNSRQASFRMTLFIVLYCLTGCVVAFIPSMDELAVLQPIQSELEAMMIFWRLHHCFQSFGSLTLISSHEIANVILGCLAFGLAWAVFERATSVDESPASARPVWTWSRRPTATRRRLRFGSAPIVFKEFYLTAGGWKRLVIKFLLYGAGLSLMQFFILRGSQQPFQFWPLHDDVVRMSWVLLFLAVVLEAAILASRIYQEEIRDQTWSTLVTTPLNWGAICYGKVIGVLPGVLPAIYWLVVVLFGTEQGMRIYADMDDDVIAWGFLMQWISVIHLAALISLFVRWGAVVLAGAAVWVPFMLLVIGTQPSGPNEIGAFLVCVNAVVCLVCHIAISERLRVLASQ